MKFRASRSPRTHERRHLPLPSTVAAGVALFIALGGSAIAANSLIHARNIAANAVTSKAIRNGAVVPRDLSPKTRALLHAPGGQRVRGRNRSERKPRHQRPGRQRRQRSRRLRRRQRTRRRQRRQWRQRRKRRRRDRWRGRDQWHQWNQWHRRHRRDQPHRAAVGHRRPDRPPHRQSADHGGRTGGSCRQLCRLGKDAAVPHGCRRFRRMRPQGRRRHHRPGLDEDTARACRDSGVATGGHHLSPSQLSVQCSVLVANGSADFSSLIAIPTG